MGGPENENYSGSRGEPRRDKALISLGVLIAGGLIFSMLYSVSATSSDAVVGRLVVAALTAGAAAMIGGLLGFLFGIPRTFQDEPGAETSRGAAGADRRPAYRPNTSLEQISDWLTKILVGVGLTQIGALQTHFTALGQNLGRAFGGQPMDEAFVTSLVAMLLVCGFLFGFLWTRIYLPSAFRAADLDMVRGEVREQLGRQADTDAEALSLADQQLSAVPGQTPVSEEKLVSAFSKASSNARLFVFERASINRSLNWQDPNKKTAMERSIPIFRALVNSGVDSPIAHRYYGQLGYALKDQSTPDWKGADDQLTTAIRLRGPWDEYGYTFYELNRAICRIMLDEAFQQDRKSDAGTRATILADLRAAYQSGLDDVVQREEIPVRWLALNKIPVSSLGRE